MKVSLRVSIENIIKNKGENMYLSMDMGTSSTRLWLNDRSNIIAQSCESFGASFKKMNGAEAFFERVNTLIDSVLSDASIQRTDVECMIVSGMGGSEIGLCEIAHISLPVDLYKLADSVVRKDIPEISGIDVLFVPGIKQTNGTGLCDIMRGEETELYGILSDMSEAEDCTFVFPGTHNKIIRVNSDGRIEHFCTTMSGEMIDLLVRQSILAGSVSHDFKACAEYVLRGALDANQNGIGYAAFHTRVMSKNGVDVDSLSSYIYGAVISQDISVIGKIANGSKIYVGGRRGLRDIYSILLQNENTVELEEKIALGAVRRGLGEIYRIYSTKKKKAEIIKKLEREKLIAIIRDPDTDTLFKAVDALYEGGVRFLEVTFDRSGKTSSIETAKIISMLCEKYKGRMHIGAGTVTSIEQVELTAVAGGEYIISPNTDAKVIAHTREIGLVAIPGAYTATEIAAAAENGADFIKLFPADDVSFKYVKAVKAPLSDIRLLAVGGVNAENARSFIENGFCGVGVGSNLYDLKLVRDGRFAELTERARAYIDALKT